MAKDNSYEEARKQRVEDNLKRFEDLGILTITKSLLEVRKVEKKSLRTQSSSRPKVNLDIEPRRSSRPRTSSVLYQDEFDAELPPLRKKSRKSSSTRDIATLMKEGKFATDKQRNNALKQAENLLKQLDSRNPCCIKSMVRSHVYSCFWLGLPSTFCSNHLPSNDVNMILENSNGNEYEAKYLGNRAGLSGGWKRFALDNKLKDGDAVIFELTEPARLKVHIIRHQRMAESDSDVEKSAVVEPPVVSSKKAISKTKRGRNPKKPDVIQLKEDCLQSETKIETSEIEEDDYDDEILMGPVETTKTKSKKSSAPKVPKVQKVKLFRRRKFNTKMRKIRL